MQNEIHDFSRGTTTTSQSYNRFNGFNGQKCRIKEAGDRRQNMMGIISEMKSTKK